MIFILNRQERVVNTLREEGGANIAAPFFDDLLVEDLITGSETFQFTTIANGSTSKDIVVGNYVAFQKNGKFKMFQIMQTEETHEENIFITAYCECAGLSLINKVFRKTSLPSTNLRKFLEVVLAESDWEIGLIDMSTEGTTLALEFDDSTVYEVLQNTIGKFGGELDFRVEIQNNKLTKKYIDVYARKGKLTGNRFSFGLNVEGITRKVDATNLYTALIGRGKNGITFKDIEAPNKPIGQDFIYDSEAFNKYNVNGYHLMGVYNFETDSPEELLRETEKQLQKVKEPVFEYEVSIVLLQKILGTSFNDVAIGDTVTIVDHEFNPAIGLMARVSQLETSFTDPQSNKCTLSNYTKVNSNISDELRKIASTLQGYVSDSIENRFPIKSEDVGEGQITGSHIYQNSITTDHLNAQLVQGVTGRFERIEVETAKIENLEAKFGKIDEIESEFIKVEELVAGKADIGTLNAVDAKIDQLASNVITTEHLSAVNAKVESLEAETAKIGNLEAEVAKIGELEVEVGKIEKLEVGIAKIENLEATVGDFENLTVQVGKIEKLETETAKIEKLETDVAKINKLEATVGDFENLTVQVGKIDNLESNVVKANELLAEKISANEVNGLLANFDRILAGEIVSDELTAATGRFNNIEAETSKIGQLSAEVAKIGTLEASVGKFGNLVAVDGTISGANISKGTITEAEIAKATILDAFIRELDASKINAGAIDTSKVSINSASGNLSIRENTIQIKDSNELTRVQIGKDAKNQYGIVVLNADGKAIFDSQKGILDEAGLSDNVISENKIIDGAVGVSKLNIDELFVNENAFINKLKAVEIDAARIKTGKIDSERIDITGLVSFESFNEQIKNNFIFDTTGEKTFINGGNIFTNSIKAESINAKGLTVEDASGKVSFEIDKVGEVFISGNLQSSNFNRDENKGYMISKNGDIIMNNALVRGDVILPNAGMTNYESLVSNDREVRFWAGTTYDDRKNAPFQVLQDGTVKATKGDFVGTFTGKLEVGNITIEDSNTTSAIFEIKTNDNLESKVRFTDSMSAINTPLTIGSLDGKLADFNVDTKTIDFKADNIYLSSTKNSIKLNMHNSEKLVEISAKDVSRDKEFNYTVGTKNGGIVIDNVSNVDEEYADFTIQRKSATQNVRVDIKGEVNVDEVIRIGTMKIIKRTQENNEGIDFII